jgi:hypothetical protein
VFRLGPDLARSDSPRDYFAAADWRALDAEDADLGGTNPLPFDVPAASGGAERLLLALGKDARAYLLDPQRSGRHRRRAAGGDRVAGADPHRAGNKDGGRRGHGRLRRAGRPMPECAPGRSADRRRGPRRHAAQARHPLVRRAQRAAEWAAPVQNENA